MVRVELTPAACALNSIHFLFAGASFDLDLWAGWRRSWLVTIAVNLVERRCCRWRGLSCLVCLEIVDFLCTM